MEITCIKAVYFSPTGNTKKVVLAAAHAMAPLLHASIDEFDFTLPEKRTMFQSYAPGDLVIFGLPVYAGRVPNKLLPYIQSDFRGNGALAIPIVTFGNRNFDHALTELRNELESNQFHSIGAAAFPCSHVFSNQIAAERPDAVDLKQVEFFSSRAAERIKELSSIPAPVSIRANEPVGPYYIPLKADGDPAQFLKAKPKTREELCNYCGICIQTCPMGSIAADNPAETPGICIKCQACVKHCHTHAKYFDDPDFLSHVAMLEQHYTRRSEPEWFFAQPSP